MSHYYILKLWFLTRDFSYQNMTLIFEISWMNYTEGAISGERSFSKKLD